MSNITKQLVKDDLLSSIFKINGINISDRSLDTIEAIVLEDYKTFLERYDVGNNGFDELKFSQLVNTEMKKAIDEIVDEASKVVPLTHLGDTEVDKNEYSKMSFKTSRQV